MAWRALQSTHMNGGDYDEETGILTVQFTNGAIYRSSGRVPQSVVDTFFQYPSPGQYYHDKIKSTYGMVKIADGMTRGGRRSRRRW